MALITLCSLRWPLNELAESQPRKKRIPFSNPLMRHVDDSVGAITNTVTTSDARVFDDNLAIRKSRKRVGRTVKHAQRVLAVTAGDRKLNRREALASPSVKPGAAPMRGRTGRLTIITSDAQIRIDKENVLRVGESFLGHKVEERAGLLIPVRYHVLDLSLLRQAEDPLLSRWEGTQQVEEIALLNNDSFTGDRGRNRRGTGHLLLRQYRHLSNVVARGDIGLCDITARTISSSYLYGALANDIEGIPYVTLLKEYISLAEALHLRSFYERLEKTSLDLWKD